MKSRPKVKPAVWGAVIGAVAMAVVGFWALATVPGSDAPNSEVATACAEQLGKAT
jgi:hypothetical protein